MVFNLRLAGIIVSGVSIFAFSCRQPQNSNETHKSESVSATDPLPSWNEGATKQSIIDFVNKTTTEGSPDFVPVTDRIACFDNDGTLWTEKPLPFQLYFVIDRIKALAQLHPEWKRFNPIKEYLKVI
jgi:hypothetical protein